jgi:hypothetical protein
MESVSSVPLLIIDVAGSATDSQARKENGQ